MATALFPDVVVNGETVPHAMIAAEAQNQSAPRGKPGLAWRKAADAVAIRTLLLQEARRRGIAASPRAVGQGRVETEEEALIRGLLDEALTPPLPDEMEIRREWARDPDRFRSPPLWEVSHILCACDPRDPTARKAAFELATEIALTALENPSGFALLAAQKSDCASRASGGKLGQLRPGDTVPEFEAAIRGLSDGEITPAPIVTRHGCHVISLDAAAEGDVLPFQAVQHRIREAMEKAAWARAAHIFVEKLVGAADITGTGLVTRIGSDPLN